MTSGLSDLYDSDVLGNDPHREGPDTIRPCSTRVHLEAGMALGGAASSWVDAVVHVERSGGIHLVELEDHREQTRSFPLGAGLWLEVRPIIALPPHPTPTEQTKNASGLITARGRALANSDSITTPKSAARVARISGIWVEGRHDAEFVQYVRDDDLVETSVIVQLLEDIDKLEEVLEVFDPNDRIRAGVLVGHLVPGSKESRIAEAAIRHWREGVLVLGHPYVDIWQMVEPSRLDLEVWPQIERGIDTKHGALGALGWSHENQVDITMGWKQILSKVCSHKGLEPALLGGIEGLIDFVTTLGLS